MFKFLRGLSTRSKIVVGISTALVVAYLGFKLTPNGVLVDSDRAIRATDVYSLTDAKVVSTYYYALKLRGCTNDDYDVAYLVSAKNQQGKAVKVSVCCGLIKPCTLKMY